VGGNLKTQTVYVCAEICFRQNLEPSLQTPLPMYTPELTSELVLLACRSAKGKGQFAEACSP